MSLTGSLRNEPGELREMVDTIPTLAWSAHPDGSAEFFNRRSLDSTLQRHLRRASSAPANLA